MLTIAQVRPYWIKIVRETNHFEKERLFENLLIMQNPAFAEMPGLHSIA